jgi:hypothetical protein
MNQALLIWSPELCAVFTAVACRHCGTTLRRRLLPKTIRLEMIQGFSPEIAEPFTTRDCRATLGRNVEQLSSTALARSQKRLRQSFYNKLVATLEQGRGRDL